MFEDRMARVSIFKYPSALVFLPFTLNKKQQSERVGEFSPYFAVGDKHSSLYSSPVFFQHTVVDINLKVRLMGT